ncbi:MAG: dTDP-4-dehydrorhamnose reductase [Pseudomonadota bacterium]
MRILIAGWQGQVARALVEAAAARPSVTALAIGRPALDLCTPATIATALSDGQPDVIINTAAYTAVDQAEDEPDAARRLNADGARMISREAQRRGATIIHLSTDYVFDGTKSGPYQPGDPTNPQSVYGRTKRDGEIAVAEEAGRHLIVRTSWVHSATAKNFVKTMLSLAETRDEVRVVGDQHGCPTYAPHLAEALLTMAEVAVGRSSDDPVWGTYHAAGAGETTWAGLASAVFDASKQNGGPRAEVTAIPTSEFPTKAERPKNSRLDCSALNQAFGISLPHWHDGVDACVSRYIRADDV